MTMVLITKESLLTMMQVTLEMRRKVVMMLREEEDGQGLEGKLSSYKLGSCAKFMLFATQCILLSGQEDRTQHWSTAPSVGNTQYF